MPTSFCTLEEAWGDDIQEQSPISRVESVIDPVSSEKAFENLSPKINFNSPFKTEETESIVKQCDICNLVLEQLKGCPDCLDKFRKMLLPSYKNTKSTTKSPKNTEIPENNTSNKVSSQTKKPQKDLSDSEYESDDEIPTQKKNYNNLSTDRIIIYVLIGIIVILLVFELYMSFNRKPQFRQPQIMQPYYGSSSNMMHL